MLKASTNSDEAVDESDTQIAIIPVEEPEIEGLDLDNSEDQEELLEKAQENVIDESQIDTDMLVIPLFKVGQAISLMLSSSPDYLVEGAAAKVSYRYSVLITNIVNNLKTIKWKKELNRNGDFILERAKDEGTVIVRQGQMDIRSVIVGDKTYGIGLGSLSSSSTVTSTTGVALGDPYIHSMRSNIPVKLPDQEACYRLLKTKIRL